MQESNYPITWKSEYSMQVKEIDDQHKHFVGILNNLYMAMEQMELNQKTDPLLKELKAYAIEHFATEEKYFDLFNFEKAAEHKIQHKDLLGKVNNFVERYSTEGIKIVPELLDFLENWLVRHLNDYDKQYVQCFKEHGLV